MISRFWLDARLAAMSCLYPCNNMIKTKAAKANKNFSQ
jgi:hypothetical protein